MANFSALSSASSLTASSAYCRKAGVDVPFFLGVGNFQGLQHPLRKPGRAIPFRRQFRLQPPHHDRFELLAVGRRAAGEPLVVEQFEQGRKALRVAVVRRGREEQLVFKVRRQEAKGLGPHRVGGVLAPARWSTVVRLIHESAGRTFRGKIGSSGPGRNSRNSRSGRSRLRKSMLVMSRGKWVHGLTWMPRLRRSSFIKLQSTMRKSRPNLSRICSFHWICKAEGQTMRIRLARCRMVSSRADHARFDGLAEAHVVGDQQVDPWHLDRPHHRIKLVVLDVDARAKGSLDVLHVSRGGSTPAHGIKEGVELVGRIEAGGFGQGDLLDDLGPRLDFPDDLQFFAQAVVLNGGEREQVLRDR